MDWQARRSGLIGQWPKFGWDQPSLVLQDPWELASFICWVERFAPNRQTYLEVGAAAGGTTRILAGELGMPSVRCIDANVPGEKFIRPRQQNVPQAVWWIGNSHSPQCQQWLAGENTAYDLVLIDGDHSYEGVRADTYLVLPFCHAGTVLAFHDALLCPGVATWVEQLKGGLIPGLYHRASFRKSIGLDVFDFRSERHPAQPKIAAVCCTYLRPRQLEEMIHCFERQDWPDRELVILDDAGQYSDQVGDRWRLVSRAERYPNLGAKRNAAAGMVSPDVDAISIWDDDDLYLPWHLSAAAAALQLGQWHRPDEVLGTDPFGALVRRPTGGLYHPGWSYLRDVYQAAGGYPDLNSGEDQAFAGRLAELGVTPTAGAGFRPSLIYRWAASASYHLSSGPADLYERLTQPKPPKRETLSPRAPVGVRIGDARMEFPRRAAIAAARPPRTIRLMRAVPTAPAATGPWLGQEALQKAILADPTRPPWLAIGGDLAEGEVPWFWCWLDRPQAAALARAGRSFILGPDVLFDNSRGPRKGPGEETVLDSPHCLLLFTETDWYADLIDRHRGVHNNAPIVQWYYPIDPTPAGPVVAEWDLLIYVKAAGQAGLIEQLKVAAGKRTYVIEYGKFYRAELAEAARRSRACAYLCDDERFGLAAAEILLAGCPLVGMPWGCPLAVEGSTGAGVDGWSGDWTAAVLRAQQMDRNQVRAQALELFDAGRQLRTIYAALKPIATASFEAITEANGRARVSERMAAKLGFGLVEGGAEALEARLATCEACELDRFTSCGRDQGCSRFENYLVRLCRGDCPRFAAAAAAVRASCARCG